MNELKNQYLLNPSGFQPTAYWKLNNHIKNMNLNISLDDNKIIIDNDHILHTYHYFNQKPKLINKYQMMIILNKYIQDFNITEFNEEKYFKLIHNLYNIADFDIDNRFYITEVNISKDMKIIEDIINQCYTDIKVTQDNIKSWTQEDVFQKDLWIKIIDSKSNKVVAVGIADFDNEIKEGSLEWIQVLPEYQGQKLGKALVLTLLHKLKAQADFVSVSGQVDNQTNPETLYRRCGFTGDVIWHILRKK